MSLRYLPVPVLAAAILVFGCSSTAGEAAPAPSPTPADDASAPSCSPIPAASEKVRVENAYGSLEGTLDVPDGCGRLPVVLILSGSGSTDRDGNTPGAPDKPAIYRILAESMRAAGIAVLRYDDHGVGKSASAAPRLEEFRFETEVEDAARFVSLLRKDARFGAVLAAGHSQGSLTGILAAQKAPLDGFISLAGAGRPVGRLMHDQLAPRLSADDLARLDAAIAKLEAGELAGPLPAPLDQVLPTSIQPYMASWMKYDPKAEIAKLRAPTLLLQGRLDYQVSELDANMLAQGKPDAALTFVDDMGHMLRAVTGKDAPSQYASYHQPLPIHPNVVTAITDFATKAHASP